MPPKAHLKGRKSQTAAPQMIPIYDILVDKQKENSVRDIIKKIDVLVKKDTQPVEKSIIIFVLKTCGLDSCVQKIDQKDPIQSIKELLEQMCQENQKPTFVNQLYLVNTKSKFHKEFVQRVKQFLQIVISDQLPLMSETQIMKIFYELLLVISTSKMRNIRNCSIQLSNFIIERSKQYYLQLLNKNNNRKASKILAVIEQGYLNNIIKPRFKDIDLLIRQKSFQIVLKTVLELNKQFLTVSKLSQFFNRPISQNKTKITQLCLKSITKLFQSDKQKIGTAANKNLQQYAIETIKILDQLALIPNRNSCLAMDGLLAIHNFNSRLDALKPKIIAKIFEIHGYQKHQQGLKKAVLIFFKSLISFSSKQQLNEHKALLMIQITHLLCSINSSKLLQTILYEFFHYSSLFCFDQMFLLLMTEYYHRDGSDIQLHQKQLNVVCTMICQFNLYVRQEINKEQDRLKQQVSFNKNVLTNCKQIFYQKMKNHSSIAHLYLRLFSLLFMPAAENYNSYVDFIGQKILDFVKQQQYLNIVNDNLVSIQQVIHECAAICEKIFPKGSRTATIMKCFGVRQITDKQTLNSIQIIKCSALASHFECQQFLNEKTIKNILRSYKSSDQIVVKLQYLAFVYQCHRRMFVSLFNEPSPSKHTEYIQIRNNLIDFIFLTILQSGIQQVTVKLAAFNVLCKSLTLISNYKISDVPVVYFEPTFSQMQILFGFVNEVAHLDDQPSVGEISLMMSTISLQNQQMRQQVLSNIFSVFTQCVKLSWHKQSVKFILKCFQVQNATIPNIQNYIQNFLYEVIKLEIQKQNGNRFIFWRLFGQITKQIPFQAEERMSYIVNKLTQIYYKFKRGQTAVKNLLSNKLMLYIADSIDKAMSNNRYEDLQVLRKLIQKCYRRFPKQTLQRLSIFYSSKINTDQSKIVFNLKNLLLKVSKTKKNSSKNTQQKNQSGEQSASEQNQDNQSEKENKVDDEDQIYKNTHLRKEQDIMVQKKTNRNNKSLRNNTKKKN